MVRRQPALLSVSVSGNVLEVTEFFRKEMGLETDQIAKIYCSHPQVTGCVVGFYWRRRLKLKQREGRRWGNPRLGEENSGTCDTNKLLQSTARKTACLKQPHPSRSFGRKGVVSCARSRQGGNTCAVVARPPVPRGSVDSFPML